MKKINNRSKTPNENDDVTIREVLTADIQKNAYYEHYRDKYEEKKLLMPNTTLKWAYVI